MKKILLISSILLYCLSSKAQTLNANPTTITSGGSVVITGNGEGSVAYYSTLFLSAVRLTSGSGSVTGVISNFKAFNKATFAPTSFNLQLTSSSSSPVTVFVELTTTVNNDVNQTNNQRIENVAQTITINPASVQPPPANTTYYNQTTSANFTKNNCGTGYTGSVVRYTVASNQYSSTISQADANSKATADVNANGQNYANTNGTCTVAVIAYSYTLSANQGFSTTYQWTDYTGVVRTQHIEKGGSTTVCAQEGTVTGGPYTKGGVCH